MEENELFTTRQVADELGVSDSLIRRLVMLGKATPTKRIANLMLFSREEIEKIRNRDTKTGRKKTKQ